MRATAILVVALLCAAQAGAQGWPARPVRLVVPFAPGGSADTLGRTVAQKLAEDFKQPFVVENRPGAGGVIGSELVAKAVPDGYTLLVSGVASHAVAPALPAGTPYDPLRDFTHIALFGGPPAVLIVSPSLAANDLQQLIALAKARPGALSYGSPGNGTQGHLVGELLKQLAGIQMQHVPYRGASVAVADVIAGHIPVASTTLSTAAGQIHAGRARALAVSTATRLPDYPGLPTFVEQGFPELVATIWFSLSAPANLPAEIADRLNAGVRRALESPDVRQRLRPEGIEPGRLDAREFASFVQEEMKRWAPVVRASGAKND